MKKLICLLGLAATHFAGAQLVTLSKVERSQDSSDKYLYKITDPASAKYLGELEVEGFSADDAAVFAKVYKKAKQIGANAFRNHSFLTLDDTPAAFNPAHYKLDLYYSGTFPKENNIAYIFSSGEKSQKIRVDGKKVTLEPRSYIKKIITFGGENSVSAGNLLGSRITLTAKEGQPAQYFQVSAFDIKGDKGDQGGLNIKSGDVVGLEKSYAEFLSTIYKEQKLK